MAMAAWLSVEIPRPTIIPVGPGGRTPVIPPFPLAILGEPVPTTYVVDSLMVIVTKRRTSKPCTRIQGTVVTLEREGCFLATGGASPPVLKEVLVRVRTPVCVRGRGKAWGGSDRATKTGMVSASLPWCSKTPRGGQPAT